MKKTLQEPVILFALLLASVIMISTLLLNIGCSNEKIPAGESASKDSSETGAATEEKASGKDAASSEEAKEPSYKLLYQLTGNIVTEINMAGTKCYLLNFTEFFDAGIINPDGTGNKILDLKKYPTCAATSKKLTDYYYIYSPNNPVTQAQGFSFFNFDIEGQTLIKADFKTNTGTELISTSQSDRHPGDLLVSSENEKSFSTTVISVERVFSPGWSVLNSSDNE